MKNFILFSLITLFMIMSFDADAQRKKRKKRRPADTEETKVRLDTDQSLWQSLNKEIMLGSGFGQSNSYYTQIALSLKANVGHHISKVFTAGVGTKVFYNYINYRGPYQDLDSEHLFDLGAFAYARAKFLQNYYIQVEYSGLQLASYSIYPKETYYFPSVGGGYMNTINDRWSVGSEIMFNISEDLIDNRGNPIDVWINFSYNF